MKPADNLKNRRLDRSYCLELEDFQFRHCSAASRKLPEFYCSRPSESINLDCLMIQSYSNNLL